MSQVWEIYMLMKFYLARVKPTRKVKKLENFEIKSIVINTKKILKRAIKLGGSSIKDFSSGDGKKGEFQQHFNVYNQNGKKCSNIDCSYKVARIVISNRSSFFCKKCQK